MEQAMHKSKIELKPKAKWSARSKLIVLGIVAATLIALFLFTGINSSNWDYNIPRRASKIAAIALTGASTAVSSLIFQTITNNRILTPGVMGLDSLYLFLQTVIVFAFGSRQLTLMTGYTDFILSCGFMIGFSLLLYFVVFQKGQRNIFILVLVGMVFGSFFGSLATFMQVLIDPNEFQILQGKMFASFNNVNTQLLGISVIITGAIFVFIFSQSKKLDVMALGRDVAINLGVDFDKQVMLYLTLVAILVSVSTALVGPITFLGILVVNLARQLFATYKHSILGLAASLISVIALVGGQFALERIFAFNTPVSVIINFIGGIYFIALLLRERKEA